MQNSLPGPPRATLASTAPANLPPRFIPILNEADALAQGKLPELNTSFEQHRAAIGALLTAAVQPELSARASLAKLREAAQLFNEAALPFTACAKGGCSHCCHIPVAINEVEAALIGQEIGRRPHRLKKAKPISNDYGYDMPCPFLKSGRCSIYKSRPLACRVHLNLDDSDRLCKLVPDVSIPVPLVNATQLLSLYVQVAPDSKLADLRDFFG
jgi:Fe-S-cluster containining protein